MTKAAGQHRRGQSGADENEPRVGREGTLPLKHSEGPNTSIPSKETRYILVFRYYNGEDGGWESVDFNYKGLDPRIVAESFQRAWGTYPVVLALTPDEWEEYKALCGTANDPARRGTPGYWDPEDYGLGRLR